ncbi:MAG: hypothetical protein RL284_2084 [Bacteroidota bacterium]
MTRAIKFSLCVFSWFLGVYLSSLIEYVIPYVSKHYISQYDSMQFVEIFFYLLKTNGLVGLIISYLGYLTAGFITILILLFNGYLFGLSFFPFLKMPIMEQEKYALLCKLFGHVPFEITAFCLFGIVGLTGFDWFVNLFNDKDLGLSLPRPKSLILPFAFLLIATILESYAIYR